jgi:hypothetical protein
VPDTVAAVRIETARDEGHRSGRRLVQPVGVVDHAQKRLLFGDRRKETQGTAEDGETLRDGLAAECQCRTECDCLRLRNRVDRRERRAEELVQAGERDVDLRLHTERAERAHAVRALDGGAQQGALADARLAANHECAAAPLSCRVEHLGDPPGLTLAAEKHRG